MFHYCIDRKQLQTEIILLFCYDKVFGVKNFFQKKKKKFFFKIESK